MTSPFLCAAKFLETVVVQRLRTCIFFVNETQIRQKSSITSLYSTFVVPSAKHTNYLFTYCRNRKLVLKKSSFIPMSYLFYGGNNMGVFIFRRTET